MAHLKVTITDTMAFWDDFIGDYVFNPKGAKTYTTWYRVPEDWLLEDALMSERRERLLEFMYGETWRSGNGDGSKYQVLNIEQHKLTDDEIAQKPWLAGNYNCYAVGADGAFADIAAKDL